MSFNPELLRQAMRHWASSVAVVSSCSADKRQIHGLTANSFTSISLDPPLAIVSIRKVTRTHALIRESGVFAVSILHAGQRPLSDRFAGKDTEHTDRFAGLSTFVAATGAPILAENIGYVDCRVQATHDAGEAILFIAEVVAAQGQGEAEPLVYCNREYHRLAKL